MSIRGWSSSCILGNMGLAHFWIVPSKKKHLGPCPRRCKASRCFYKHWSPMIETSIKLFGTCCLVSSNMSWRLSFKFTGCQLRTSCWYPLYIRKIYSSLPLHFPFVGHSCSQLSTWVFLLRIFLCIHWVSAMCPVCSPVTCRF